MTRKLLDLRMEDGARHFLEAPAKIGMAELLARLNSDADCKVLKVLPGHAGSWLEFGFAGYRFSANDPFGEVWLFAEDARTPEAILLALADRLFPCPTGA